MEVFIVDEILFETVQKSFSDMLNKTATENEKVTGTFNKRPKMKFRTLLDFLYSFDWKPDRLQ
ncbi:hypothetical protein [Paenisporosarcina sp. TG20]|uniref:hypothetical protein n=1 Tax=Paenisporosarcina sp. TG20 TaxID=1211706 RepID=UPI0003121E64|nr:hypothetical protein [Paenisporosarcina sp. TG20]